MNTERRGSREGNQENNQLDSREAFDSAFGRFLMGRVERANDDGSTTEVRAYEFVLDPSAQGERRGIAVTFLLRAAAAGYCPLGAPLVIPGAGYADPSGERPLTAVYWFLQEGPDSAAKDPTR